jgi:ATP-dependent Clp protease ATP-binding subunit ClpA
MPIEQRVDRFSVEAAKAFDLACHIAQERGHASVEIGHLLLALKRTDNSVAQYVLNGINVDDRKIEDFITKTLKDRGPSSGSRPTPSISLGSVFERAAKESVQETEQMRRAIAFVIDNDNCEIPTDVRQTLELMSFRLRSVYPPIGTEHLLLGSVWVGNQVGVDVLALLGITLSELLERVHLAHSRHAYLV